MLKFHDSLKVASKILNTVKKLLREKNIKTDAWVEAYSNCREQGYCIRALVGVERLSISFSESRGSDQIVVYVGGGVFDPGNIPTDEAYKNAKYFPCAGYEKAAAFIVGEIKKSVKVDQQWFRKYKKTK